LPITFEKDSENNFKVVSCEDCEPEGEVRINDVISKVNGINPYGDTVNVTFSSQDCGFTTSDLKVKRVKRGGEAESNGVVEGMVVRELNGKYVRSDTELKTSIREQNLNNLNNKIMFTKLYSPPKTLEVFVEELKRLEWPATLEFRRWVPYARQHTSHYSSCGVGACGPAPR